MDQFSLKDKVIVVTGGTGILGEAFVNGIAGAGGTAVILGRKLEVAQLRAQKIIDASGRALAIQADVLKKDEIIAARGKVLAEFGKIDGLVNAAGGNMPGGIVQPEADVFDLDMDGLRQVMELNLWGTLLPTQYFGKEIAKNATGSIVNISSMASQRAITKVLGYTLAKTAVDAYTKWFAVETANRYGDRVRMNAIAPGFFLTEQNRTLLTTPDGGFTTRGNLVINQTPFKRFGVPEELVGALIWLLSDASKFVTGTVINVDGGFAVNSGV
ncbi:SDR family oxidoreductase [Mucilaginibacter psychrotolerans]|uniref:SDR family oxidoreductase n=1 Tax=Mucilaginibacter psychrotolerans TaxID=1524096 RepID=A0A4Y8SG39_9SPHI|nr:SDR family oxidoreductase [Mucilaginibacter psychrotolerans]TFF37517.1 SDR family oxidoreductase [Mucilaginibacter psychrotolerans]